MNCKNTCIALLVLLCLAVAPPVSRAQATVELQVESQQVFVGEAFGVEIEIAGYETCSPPNVPRIDHCTVRQAGPPSTGGQIYSANGRVSQFLKTVYHYEFTPQVVGNLVIPAIPVQVDGRVQQTREKRLKVRPSNAHELFAVELTANRQRVYVGQRVRLTLTIWVRPARYRGRRYDANYMSRRVSLLAFGPFPRRIDNIAEVRHSKTRPRQIGDTEVPFFAYDFVTDVLAERPGPLNFADIEVGISYPDRGRYRNLRARPEVAPVEVSPIPMEGRPANFNGAVGLFDIETRAAPTDVRVGDPIELTIEIFGDGALETLPPPLLTANEDLTRGFRLPAKQLAGVVQNGRRRFTLTIRAGRDDVGEIPAIEYPYFDPDAERFVIARSDPIPLTVAPAAEVAAPDLTRTHTPSAGAAQSNLQALDGLRDIETSETLLLANSRPITLAAVSGLMFGPPAFFLLVWAGQLYVQRRTADPARRRRQTALRTARRRLAQTRTLPPREHAGEVAAALAAYLADRLNEPPARFTGAAAGDFLQGRGVPSGLIERWSTLVQRCEEASFAGGTPANAEELSKQALACLTALERQKL